MSWKPNLNLTVVYIFIHGLGTAVQRATFKMLTIHLLNRYISLKWIILKRVPKVTMGVIILEMEIISCR